MKISLNNLRNVSSFDDISRVWKIRQQVEDMNEGGLDGLPNQLPTSLSGTTTSNTPIF